MNGALRQRTSTSAEKGDDASRLFPSSWQRSHLLLRSGLTFILSLLLFGWTSCETCRVPPRVTEAEKRQTALHIKQAVERTAGPTAWVKSGSAAPDTVEVLVLPPKFDALVRAIVRQAETENLKASIKESRAGHERRTEIQLHSSKGLVGRWRLRQVRQWRRAAIIIDDLGQTLEVARKLRELPYPMAWAVLPHQPHSVQTAEMAHRAGREVLLHLPMQPEPGSPVGPGEGAVMLGMSREEVARVIEADLDFVPYAIGANNHMGSLATTDARLMGAVMRVLGERRLFFVDSRTTTATVALDAARQQGLASFYRSVFLDDTESVPYTLGQLRRFCAEVEKSGAGLAIGHPYPTTFKALVQFLPQLEKRDIQLVPVSRFVRLPEVARLSPTRSK